MIELKTDTLSFTFPDVHPSAGVAIEFQRTLRIPDDGKTYPLPPGLGRFPLRHIDDYASKVPAEWVKRGGVMFPMYPSEAMWMNFRSAYVVDQGAYPVAIKIATGKRSAVTGEAWRQGLHVQPDQDYVVSPRQPWLDGYVVKKGEIRQFVAMPLGAGYSVEEQLTGKSDIGGVQIEAYPMKREEFERRFPKIVRNRSKGLGGMMPPSAPQAMPAAAAPMMSGAAMGLGAGGSMRQEIFEDPFGLDVWDTDNGHRCFVHLVHAMVWREVTGKEPPTTPPTAREYNRAGLPWYDYYGDGAPAVQGSKLLSSIKSIFQLGKDKGDVPLPENESVDPKKVVALREGLAPGQVREGDF